MSADSVVLVFLSTHKSGHLTRQCHDSRTACILESDGELASNLGISLLPMSTVLSTPLVYIYIYAWRCLAELCVRALRSMFKSCMDVLLIAPNALPGAEGHWKYFQTPPIRHRARRPLFLPQTKQASSWNSLWRQLPTIRYSMVVAREHYHALYEYIWQISG